MRVKLWVRVLLVFAFAALGASKASAQSIIAGVARDTSGAVLPGVTVEASSDVLIEKSRTVTTDGDGRYSIVDLRPGTYSVIFTLPGFSTFKRDAVIVPSNVTVPINAEMKVGSLEETVTVSGQSPVVDVQNVSKMQVLTRELMDSIPTARNMQAIGALVPGIRLNLPDVGGAQQTEQTYMAVHGNSSLHNTILLDGMPAQTNLSDGAVQNYIDNALIDESVYQTSAISAESFGGRRSAQPGAQGRRQHGSRVRFLRRRERQLGSPVRQRGRLLKGSRSWQRRPHQPSLRLQRRRRRADQEGQSLVLRVVATPGNVHPGAEHVPEQRRARRRRRLDQQLRGPRYVAGDAQEQVCGDLPAQLQNQAARNLPRRTGRRPDLPGANRWLSCPVAVLHRAGEVDVSRDEPPPARGGPVGRHPALLRHLSAGNERRTRQRRVVRQCLAPRLGRRRTSVPHQGWTDRAVEFSGPEVGRRELVVRDGHAQHQDRPSVRVGQQPVDARHERRPLSALSGRNARRQSVHARRADDRCGCTTRRSRVIRI